MYNWTSSSQFVVPKRQLLHLTCKTDQIAGLVVHFSKGCLFEHPIQSSQISKLHSILKPIQETHNLDTIDIL